MVYKAGQVILDERRFAAVRRAEEEVDDWFWRGEGRAALRLRRRRRWDGR